MKIRFLTLILLSFINANGQEFEFDAALIKLKGITSCTVTDFYQMDSNETKRSILQINSHIYRFDSLGRVFEITDFNNGDKVFTSLNYNGYSSLPISKNSKYEYSGGCYGLREYPTKRTVVREQFGKIKYIKSTEYLYQKLFKFGNKKVYNPFKTRTKYKYIYDKDNLLREIRPSKKYRYISTKFFYKT